MRGILFSVGAKGATMVVALGCGVVTARLLLGGPGTEFYALYSLLVALPSLITFTDLGSGAAVVTRAATAEDPRHDDHLRRTVLTVCRILLGAAAVLLVLNGVLLLGGGWEVLLGVTGDLPGAPLAAAACLLTFAVTVSLAVWHRLLLGLQRNHLVILAQGAQSPINLLLVAGLLGLGGPRLHAFLGLGSFLAALLVALLGTLLATRLSRPLLATVRRQVLRPRRWPGTRVMDVGWPMLAQVLAAPLSLTLQRYVLAQRGTADQLAQYAVLGQVFFAVQGLVAAVGVTLWPAFARARAEGRLNRGPWLISAGFATGVAVLTLVVLLLREPLFGFISDGVLQVEPVPLLLFGAMVASQALLFPLGMFIMDAPGLRFQVVPVFAMVVSTIVLSILLTPSLGVSGPLLANLASVLVLQVLPFGVYIHRRRRELWQPPEDHG